jgi:hypothetical protein
MNVRHSVRAERDHTRVDVAGEFEATEAREVLRTALALALQNGHSKLLVDARQVTGNPRTMERFDLGENLARYYHETRGDRLVRIALVGKEPLVDPQKFGVLVAANRGVPVMVTTDIEEALRWLEVSGAG